MKRITVFLAALVTMTFMLDAQFPETAPQFEWLEHLGGTGPDRGTDLAVDPDNNIYVTGIFSGEMTLGGTTLTGTGFEESFVGKFQQDGSMVWLKKISCSEGRFVRTKAVETDPAGNVYVTGYSDADAIYFGGNVVMETSGQDLFLVKYDSDGNDQWATTYQKEGDQHPNRMTVDDEGSSYILFADGWNETDPNSGRIVKFDADGNTVWINPYNWGSMSDIHYTGQAGGYSFAGNDTSHYPLLQVPGSINGWNYADSSYVLASVDSNEIYQGYLWLRDFDEFKFTVGPSWAANYGDFEDDGLLDWYGDNIHVPDGDGYYKIDADTVTKVYTMVKTAWGVLGSATKDGEVSDQNMVYDVDSGYWSATIDLTAGNIRFRANDANDLVYGDDDADGILEENGSDIVIPEAGLYRIRLILGSGDYTYSLEHLGDRLYVSGTTDGYNDFGSTEFEDGVFIGYYGTVDPATGEFLQARKLDLSGGYGYNFQIETDGPGNIYIAGVYQPQISYEGTTLSNSNSTDHVFLAKMDPAGNLQYLTGPNGVALSDTWMTIHDLVVDEDQNAWLFGLNDNILIAGGDTTDAGNFCIRYDASGNEVWLRQTDSWFDGDVIRTRGDSLVTTFWKDDPNSIYLALSDTGLTTRWTVGSEGDWGWSNVTDVAIDTLGNGLVTGLFDGAQDFLDTAWTDGRGIYLAATDTAGAKLWSKLIRVDGDLSIYNNPQIHIDEENGIYLYGGSDLTLYMENDAVTIDPGAFILKFDDSGTLQWMKIYDSWANGAAIQQLTHDAQNDLVLTGQYNGSVTVGSATHNSNGEQDVFIAKLDASDGSVIWTKNIGDAGQNFSMGIACGASDTIYASVLTTIPPSNEMGNVDMMKYDPDGNLVWSKQVIENTWAYHTEMAADQNGSVYLNGGSYADRYAPGYDRTIVDTIDIYPEHANYITYLANFNTGGHARWIKKIEAEWWIQSRDIEVDSVGNIYFNAQGGNNLYFEEYTLQEGWADYGISWQNVMLKASSEGDNLWGKQFYVGSLETTHIAVDQPDRVFMGFAFNGGIHYDDQDYMHTETNGSFGFLSTPPIVDTTETDIRAYGPNSLVLAANVMNASSFRIEIKESAGSFEDIEPALSKDADGTHYYLLDSLNGNTQYILRVSPINQADTGLAVTDTAWTRSAREMIAYLPFEIDYAGYAEEALSGKRDEMIHADIVSTGQDSLGNGIAFYGRDAIMNYNKECGLILDSALYDDLTDNVIQNGSVTTRYMNFTEATYSFWFRVDDGDIARNGAVLTSFGGGWSNGICLYDDSLWIANANRTGDWVLSYRGIPFNSSKWTHATWVFRNGITKLYLNGVMKISMDDSDEYFWQTFNASDNDHQRSNQIGSVYWYNRALNEVLPEDLEYDESWHHPFEGMMDELKFYNYALSDSAVLQNYASDLLPVNTAADAWTQATGPNSAVVGAWTENADRYKIEVEDSPGVFSGIIPADTAVFDEDYYFLIDSLEAATGYVFRITPMNAADTGLYGYDTLTTRAARQLIAELKFDADYSGYVKEELSGALDSMVNCSISDEAISGKSLSVEPAEVTPGVEEGGLFLDNAFGNLLTDDILEAPSSGDMTFTEASVAFWFKNRDQARTGPGEGSVLAAFGGDMGSGLFLYNDSLWFADADEITDSVHSGRGIPFVSPDWNHLVWVYRHDTTVVYLNGQKVIESMDDRYFWQSFNMSADHYDANQLGSVYWYHAALDKYLPDDLTEQSYHHLFDGLIDEFRVYNYGLGPQEIDTMYAYLIVDSVVVVQPLCHDDSTGSLTIHATGGLPPYTYSIDGGTNFQSDSIFAGLPEGTYELTTMDASGATRTVTDSITAPDSIVLLFTVDHYDCSTGWGGTLDLTVSGGTQPYTFEWSDGTSTEDISGLPPGTYTVALTDQHSCVQIDSAVVNPAERLLIVLPDTVSFCFGDSAWIQAPDGYADYLWSTGATDTLLLWTNTSGTYWLQVTDTLGCRGSDTTTAVEKTAIVINAELLPYNCDTDVDGGITLNISGGSAPYGVDWTYPALPDTAVINGLAAGDYPVTITDSLNCLKTDTITLPTSGNIEVTISSDTVEFCSGDSVSVSAEAGYANYNWSSLPGDSSQVWIKAEGTYWVRVSDSRGCSTIPDTILAIGHPTPDAATTSDKSVCEGGAVPDLSATGTGIRWYDADTILVHSGSPFQTGLTAPGQYRYLVCRSTQFCEGPYTPVILSINASPADRGITDTSVCETDTLRFSGQDEDGHSYEWFVEGTTTPLSVTADFENVPASVTDYVYHEQIDSSACERFDTFTVSIDPIPEFGYEVNKDAVNPGNNATITLDGDSYSYAFSPADDITQLSSNIFNAAPMVNTSYTITGTSAEGCSSEITADVFVFCEACSNETLTDTTGVFNHGCTNRNYRNSANCSWTFLPSGMIEVIKIDFAADSFDIRSGDLISIYEGSDATGNLVGSYDNDHLPPAEIIVWSSVVYVQFTSDATETGRGFQARYAALRHLWPEGTGSLSAGKSGIRVYPNPSTGSFRLVSGNLPGSDARVEIFDGLGQMVWNGKFELTNGGIDRTIDLSGVPAGMHYVRIVSGSSLRYATILLE